MLHTDKSFHGSDVETIEIEYGKSVDTVVNFGSNVNPLGLPTSLRGSAESILESLTHYPDRQYGYLRNAIADYCDALENTDSDKFLDGEIIDADSVVVGNGTTELINLAIKAISPINAICIGPAYSEYVRAINSCGGNAIYYFLNEGEDSYGFEASKLCKIINESQDLSLLVICNPNNPTGFAMDVDTIELLVSRCKRKKVRVIIDETYIEFADNYHKYSSAKLVRQYDNLLILRGVSKFFALPGMRLGYGLCSNWELVSYIVGMQPDWAVGSVATSAAKLVFDDYGFINETREYISEERGRIQKRLSKIKGIKSYKTQTNFFLCKLSNDRIRAKILFSKLWEKGLMIRDCSTFEGLDGKYFRFCIMEKKDNDRLLDAIDSILSDRLKHLSKFV